MLILWMQQPTIRISEAAMLTRLKLDLPSSARFFFFYPFARYYQCYLIFF